MFDKPGCFGYASTYDHKSKACQACGHSNECSIKALANLEELSKRLNVDALVKVKHGTQASEKPKVDSVVEKVLSQFPESSRKVAEQVLSKPTVRKDLMRGVNQITSSPACMRVLFDELLSGETDRSKYVQALKKSGYSDSSAITQASIGIKVATGLRIAKVDERGNITLRRG